MPNGYPFGYPKCWIEHDSLEVQSQSRKEPAASLRRSFQQYFNSCNKVRLDASHFIGSATLNMTFGVVW